MVVGFITSQDESHEGEPAIDQALAEGEEEQDPGEWVAGGGTELITSQDERGGGTEFFASQDEPHEEDAGNQATAEEGDGRPTHSTHTHVKHTHTRRTPGSRQRGL